ncbi:MAG: molybdenum cofactor guanylyltransferase [Alphaproteobacteria bacterium]|nr:molybdenum cofactor guanylyltransferase [Alphaproteobacteria bacterium]MCB9984715.1 molybdenum cofactor guanylyltransferase [Micavibrio sp.]
MLKPKKALSVVVDVEKRDMRDRNDLAGVILAGGRSSRMGSNKALLSFGGRPLIEHMQQILRDAGFNKIIISGSVKNYTCVPDKMDYQGPAKAIEDIICANPETKGFLFIPVDMPFLNQDILNLLLKHSEGAYFKDSPLPAYIPAPHKKTQAYSVRKMLDELNINPIKVPESFVSCMKNANTPEDWAEVINA